MKKGTSQLKSNLGSLKSTSSLKKGKGLKTKPKSAEKVQEAKVQRDKDWKFYTEIFQNRGNRCQACDVIIYGELTTANADHLLEKSKHKHLRYEPENIAVVCIQCHSNKTNCGTITEDYRQLIEIAKQKFKV